MSEKKHYSAKKVLLWYWRTLPHYRRFYIGIFLFYGLGTLSSNTIAPLFYKSIIDDMASGIRAYSIGEIAAVLVGLAIIYNVFYRIADILYARTETNGTRDLARFNFGRLHRQSYEFFTKESAGSLIAKSNRFIGAYEDLLSDVTFAFWTNFLKFVGMIVVLLILKPLLAALVFVSTLLFMVISIPFLRRSWNFDNEHSEANSRVTERFADVVTNALTMKVFSALGREKKSFEVVTQGEADARKRAWWAFIQLIGLQAALITAVEISALVFALWMWQQGSISIGTVVLVLTYMLSLFDIVWNVSRNIGRFLRHLARASEMIQIFEQTPSVLDQENPKPLMAKKGEVEFRNVTFGYKEGKSVFHNFSLVIKPGEKVGLVGPSGAGKSTITKLLLRFFDPKDGEILIDGMSIQDVSQDDLRHALGYVPQEALLFHRPIGENIAYGKEGATQEEIEIAARKAEAHDFILLLQKGYETKVGDRGVKLSGGERQRVAIARAILKNAPILILDEATSSLDSTNEVAIQKALDELMKGKTAIVIAHRLSTIQKMDRIVVLNKEGKIEEMGTHAELLAKNGLYANLWNHQVGGFIDEDSME